MKKRVTNFILSILTACALLFDYELIYNDISKIQNPFSVGLLTVLLVTIFLTIFYNKQVFNKMHWTKWVLTCAFSIFMVFGNSYQKTDSWNLVFGSSIMIFVSLIAFIGYFALFMKLFCLLDSYILKNKKEDKLNSKHFSKVIKFFDEKPFLSSLLFIILFWLIYMIAFYPIILSPDPSFQIKQFFNVPTKYADYVIRPVEDVYMTNHHPVLHTLLLGNFLKFGRFLGSDNLGLFMYSIFQTLILASALASTIKFLKKNNVSLKSRIIVLLVYLLVPMFPFYAMSGVKDTIYTALIIYYIMFMFDFVRNKKEEQLTIKNMIMITINLLLITMFRNNGIYVIVLSFPLLIFISKTNVFKTLSIFILTIGLYGCYSKVILPSFGIADGSIREALSIPFQQTARYVKEHEDELSSNDIKIIDKVLGYEDLSVRYKPRISDPVKNNYNKYATKDDLKKYFNVWFDGLKKHPDTYVQATVNNVYGYFYPNDTNWYIYNKYDKRITEDNLVDYHYNSPSWLRNILAGYGIAFPFIPLIGLISNIGFNGWLLLIIGAYLIEKKKTRYLICMMPLYVSLLICIASPVNTYFRYTMPYVFAMPFFVPLILNIIRGDKTGK